MLLATPALAHTGQGVAGGFVTGFLHPITGPDHVVAMVAVGMWGAFLGRAGDLAAADRVPAGDVVRRRAGRPRRADAGGRDRASRCPRSGSAPMVAFAARPPLWIAAVLVGAFAIFHGYAHGAELPGATNPLAYGIGFVVATGLLHLCGISFGLLVRWPLGERVVRATGGLIACAGFYFLIGT